MLGYGHQRSRCSEDAVCFLLSDSFFSSFQLSKSLRNRDDTKWIFVTIYCRNHRKKAIFLACAVGASIRSHLNCVSWNDSFRSDSNRSLNEISIHSRWRWDIAHFIRSINADVFSTQTKKNPFARECEWKLVLRYGVQQHKRRKIKTRFPLICRHSCTRHLFIKSTIYLHIVPPIIRIPPSHLPPLQWFHYIRDTPEEKNSYFVSNFASIAINNNGKQPVASPMILFPLIYNMLQK